ncbi:MAG: hypothetical protein U5L72_02190 [Bacteroidales bacterium]|nr:hypothetical protein [Bacteroidales bacterium]
MSDIFRRYAKPSPPSQHYLDPDVFSDTDTTMASDHQFTVNATATSPRRCTRTQEFFAAWMLPTL